jgi:hypothetical protein
MEAVPCHIPEPACFSMPSCELIPKLHGRLTANEFDQQVTRAGDVERFGRE